MGSAVNFSRPRVGLTHVTHRGAICAIAAPPPPPPPCAARLARLLRIRRPLGRFGGIPDRFNGCDLREPADIFDVTYDLLSTGDIDGDIRPPNSSFGAHGVSDFPRTPWRYSRPAIWEFRWRADSLVVPIRQPDPAPVGPPSVNIDARRTLHRRDEPASRPTPHPHIGGSGILTRRPRRPE